MEKNYAGIFTVSKKPIRNRHNQSVTDTIYTFSAGNTAIEIYRAKHRDLFLCAKIDTDKIRFKYNIKVGDTKADVAGKLKAVINSDKVQVGDLEHGQVYTFTFSKGKLESVAYEGYVD